MLRLSLEELDQVIIVCLHLAEVFADALLSSKDVIAGLNQAVLVPVGCRVAHVDHSAQECAPNLLMDLVLTQFDLFLVGHVITHMLLLVAPLRRRIQSFHLHALQGLTQAIHECGVQLVRRINRTVTIVIILIIVGLVILVLLSISLVKHLLQDISCEFLCHFAFSCLILGVISRR